MINLGWSHVVLHADVNVVPLPKDRTSNYAHPEDVEPALCEVKQVGIEKR